MDFKNKDVPIIDISKFVVKRIPCVSRLLRRKPCSRYDRPKNNLRIKARERVEEVNIGINKPIRKKDPVYIKSLKVT